MRAGLASLGLRSSSKHHRKWTPAEDAIVRAHYLDKGPGGVEHMLRARSYAAIKERAKVLGVSRVVRLWTPEEDAWLLRYSSLSLTKQMAHLGRGKSGIRQRLYQLGGGLLHADRYTASQAAQIMGVDPHKVDQWITSGRLKAAKLEGEDRAGRGTWQIKPSDLRDFCWQHRDTYDVRRVDKDAYLDLIFNTKAYDAKERRA
jgi:hypothetical protein